MSDRSKPAGLFRQTRYVVFCIEAFVSVWHIFHEESNSSLALADQDSVRHRPLTTLSVPLICALHHSPSALIAFDRGNADAINRAERTPIVLSTISPIELTRPATRPCPISSAPP